MATYVPNANELTQPTGDKPVKSSAPEHRAVKAKLARTLRVPEAGELPEFPAVDVRAGKLAAFDAAGNPTTVVNGGIADPSLRADLGDPTDVAEGDALVSVKSTFTGAIARSQHSKNADILSTTDFALVGDGVADDTAAAIQAVTAARLQGGDQRILLWRKGTYKINNVIATGSNITIIFEPGVIIDATGLPNETTSLFAISNQTNVTMIGNGATFNGARATAVVEGNSAAFFVYGSDNVLIRDFNINGFATDGITLTGDAGASGPCTNVRIEGCYCNNNRRNGLSIIHAKGVVVQGGVYRNSNGAPNGPHAGIDVEPNSQNFAQNILISGVRTQDNAGPGLLLVPSAQSVDADTEFDVVVEGYRSDNDGTVAGNPALRFASGGAWTNKVYGQIIINGVHISKPKASGVGFTNWDADKAPRVVLRDAFVLNPDATSNGSNTNANRTAYQVYCDATQAVASQGNIVFDNCRAEDTRGVPRMPWGFILDADVGKTLKNVKIINPAAINFVAAAIGVVNVNAVLNGGCSNVDVTYDSPELVASLPSAAIGQWVGKRITAQTGGNQYTLPALATSIGAHYELFAPSTLGANVSFIAQVGQNIKANGAAAANTLVVAPGDSWRVWNPNGVQWVASPLS